MPAEAGAVRVSFAHRAAAAPRQPKAPPPPVDELRAARAASWRAALEPASRRAYERALRNWSVFTIAYGFPFFPSADSLSLFVVFRMRDIAYNSVVSELAGLAYHFKTLDASSWTSVRSSPEVVRALIGGVKQQPREVKVAPPLPLDKLVDAVEDLSLPHTPYDDLLWAAMMVVGFFSAARAQELAAYDSPSDRNRRKVVNRDSVILNAAGFIAYLPYHKADRLYSGSRLWFAAGDAGALLDVVKLYLLARDRLFGPGGALFLRENATIPTRRWLVDGIKARCGAAFTGHLVRAGAATWYASQGVDVETIKRIGRWSSERWSAYVRLHPSIAVEMRNHAVRGTRPFARTFSSAPFAALLRRAPTL